MHLEAASWSRVSSTRSSACTWERRPGLVCHQHGARCALGSVTLVSCVTNTELGVHLGASYWTNILCEYKYTGGLARI